MLGDAHIHLDAISNAEAISASAANVLCVSCAPSSWHKANKLAANHPTIRTAIGLHPWWVPGPASDEDTYVQVFENELEDFLEQAPNSRFVGEIGLDFHGPHKNNAQFQVEIFKKLCRSLSTGAHVVSLHTRGADELALEILSETGMLKNNVCILHGFNGSSSALNQAVQSGCLFSVGERELKTKRWREYARHIPLERLLIESDAPRTALSPKDNSTHELGINEWQNSLQTAAKLLDHLRDEDVIQVIEDNLASLLL